MPNDVSIPEEGRLPVETQLMKYAEVISGGPIIIGMRFTAREDTPPFTLRRSNGEYLLEIEAPCHPDDLANQPSPSREVFDPNNSSVGIGSDTLVTVNFAQGTIRVWRIDLQKMIL